MARNCCCGTRSATCVCAVIVLHVILAVVLVTALFTRLHVYQGLHLEDMATDTRVLSREVSNIFCSEHIVQTYLKDSVTGMRLNKAWTQQSLESNILPKFDVYVLDYDPRVSGSPVGPILYKPFGGLGVLGPGQYQHHPFRFRAHSSVSIGICSWEIFQNPYGKQEQADDKSGLAVFFVRGEENFATMTNAMVRHPDHVPNCNGDCLQSMNVTPGPSANCEVSPTKLYNLTSPADVDAQYYVIIFNPSIGNSNSTDPAAQKFRILFNLNRTEFNMTGIEPEHPRGVTKFSTESDSVLLVTFPYYLNDSSNYLYTIELDYHCESNYLVYLAVFMFAPLGMFLSLAVVVLCCRQRNTSNSRYLVSAVPSRDPDSDDSIQANRPQYGSTEPMYR